MTDKLHYPDMFKTINIPKSERRLALKAKNLFDAAYNVEMLESAAHSHLTDTIDNKNASQVFWEFRNDTDATYDHLVLTMMKQGLTIALEHRDLISSTLPVRKSLHISDGISKVYVSELRPQTNLGLTSEQAISEFKENFFETTANLGLYHQIKRLSTYQNESSSAIFASAA